MLACFVTCTIHPFFDALDAAIGKVQRACADHGYVMLVTADHGNAERMIDEAGKPVTKHTTFRGMAVSIFCLKCSIKVNSDAHTEKN